MLLEVGGEDLGTIPEVVTLYRKLVSQLARVSGKNECRYPQGIVPDQAEMQGLA